MGQQAAKPARTPPARFVSKQIPRMKRDVEEEFKRAQHTIQGINKTKEHIQTHPQPYTETKVSDESTDLMDKTAPKWYVNSMLDMMDNQRQGVAMISGNFPMSWEKDKFEPYALVRNRIDDEDSDWLLSAEVKNQPIEMLLEHTKLERQALEDILATVELPRVQYRNYQGKLHKAVEDQNTFLSDRKAQVEEAREDELLRDIGYTDEEIADEKSYRTNRPRGVKTLDDLGVSINSKKRAERAKQHNDMQAMLDARRMEAIEEGSYEPSEEDLARDPDQLTFVAKGIHQIKINKEKRMHDFDAGGNSKALSKFNWWRARRKQISPHLDAVHDVPVFHGVLNEQESKAQRELQEASDEAKKQAEAQGQKKFHDPQDDYNAMLQAMRENTEREEKAKALHEEVEESIRSTGPKKPVKMQDWSKKRDWSAQGKPVDWGNSKLSPTAQPFGIREPPADDPNLVPESEKNKDKDDK